MELASATQNACLDEETVSAFARGELSTDHRHAATQHVDRCASCRELLALAARYDSASGEVRPTGDPGELATQPFAERSWLPRGSNVGRYVVVDSVGSGSMG